MDHRNIIFSIWNIQNVWRLYEDPNNSCLPVVALLLLAPAASRAQSVAGLWDATINFNGAEIPFKFELSGDGANVKGWFFNGDDREISNSGNLQNGSLVLNFDSYLAKLTATVKNGVIDGEYGPILKKNYPIHATQRLLPSRNPMSLRLPSPVNGI